MSTGAPPPARTVDAEDVAVAADEVEAGRRPVAPIAEDMLPPLGDDVGGLPAPCCGVDS